VVADFLERVGDVGGHGVGGEILDYAAGRGVGEVGFYTGQGIWVSREQGDGEVAMGRVREDSGYTGALSGVRKWYRLELLRWKMGDGEALEDRG